MINLYVFFANNKNAKFVIMMIVGSAKNAKIIFLQSTEIANNA